MNLSKLKQIELLEAGNHEAHNFKTWLSHEENLRMLGDEIVRQSLVEFNYLGNETKIE